ncbi:pyruvate dehydrogenase (acetyl-transferring) E1 component subunit alpha [Proteiniphilum sp. UBA1028]|jgi:pyruvate dehydrogenase E1 component alpha subunit|uniref:pyruvate dehydrogenase (acetyl-transferring) E1 component subunit alpha n=1 Tax=Proteiniphilum sp. UBA1028 TaxID=1947251 RepID=UPI000E926A8B|nr:pyruvate dehydrogenase (acetyl-transferring) E1 component subunit alpha [Proteiniphilum sp. UBA1028]HBG57609.1 pyruvate dehydrogenase (acetyl-transferring) E1 component subunit alpha [Porphyromonadaceae bacterium]
MIQNNLPAIFRDFNPLEDKMLSVIDNEGHVVSKQYMPELDDETVIDAYKQMLYERTADEMAISYQRQGRMFTYTPNLGQEAIHIAAGMNIRREDWLVPAFREMGTLLAKGVTMKEMFLFYLGNEHGGSFQNAHHTLPIAISIGTQLHHATGIAYSVKYQKKDETVFTFIGDGGTSEGDFSEALNFAGVWQVPVVFTIQNNQYAISVPVKSQTKSINLAVKSVAFGIPGIKVDGNDFFAMYLAYKIAAAYTLSGKGPVLIEAFTYRLGAHTTSDDPTKYRKKEEEIEWGLTDPLIRLRHFMEKKGIWNIDPEKLTEEYKQQINQQFLDAEQNKSYPHEDVFKFMFSDMPDELKRQKTEYEQFLRWKENRK